MEKVNTISFCRENYKENLYYDGSIIDKMDVDYFSLFNDMNEFIRVALKNEYQMKIWDDGYTYIIEYELRDESMSGVSLEWLGEDEYVAKSEPLELDENEGFVEI